jgi:hypothetical protein
VHPANLGVLPAPEIPVKYFKSFALIIRVLSVKVDHPQFVRAAN